MTAQKPSKTPSGNTEEKRDLNVNVADVFAQIVIHGTLCFCIYVYIFIISKQQNIPDNNNNNDVPLTSEGDTIGDESSMLEVIHHWSWNVDGKRIPVPIHINNDMISIEINGYKVYSGYKIKRISETKADYIKLDENGDESILTRISMKRCTPTNDPSKLEEMNSEYGNDAEFRCAYSWQSINDEIKWDSLNSINKQMNEMMVNDEPETLKFHCPIVRSNDYSMNKLFNKCRFIKMDDTNGYVIVYQETQGKPEKTEEITYMKMNAVIILKRDIVYEYD